MFGKDVNIIITRFAQNPKKKTARFKGPSPIAQEKKKVTPLNQSKPAVIMMDFVPDKWNNVPEQSSW